jgi:Mechanosensitive ion channel, beta-domain
MQVHGGPQIDLSAQVAMVRRKTRPWKSIIALVLAIGAASTSGWAHSQFGHFFSDGHLIPQVIAAATGFAFLVFASAATIGLSGKAGSVLRPLTGESHAAVVRYALVLIGAVTTLIVTLVLFGVPVGQLLLGGALTSVFVGIAAQQALSNVFAGLVLLLAHPFRVGDAIRLRAGALSGEIDGTVSEIGITYVRMSCSNGMISIPNSQVLNAVVGPLPAGDYPPPPPPPPPQVWPAAVPAASLAPGPGPAPDPGLTAPVSAPVALPVPAAGTAASTADGSAAGPVGTLDGAGGAPRPGTSGEQ